MAEEDIKITITRLEENVKHFSELIQAQKDFLERLLIDNQKRNEDSREALVSTKHLNQHIEEQIDSLRDNIKNLHKRFDDFYEENKDSKAAIHEEHIKLKNMVLKLSTKVDSDWIFIFKTIGLVFIGALLGASTVLTGLKGFFGL